MRGKWGDAAATRPAFECVTWNVHRGRGASGSFDPGRVHAAMADAIAPLGAHVLALQEADLEVAPQRGFLDIDGLTSVTGLKTVHTEPSMRRHPGSSGFFGAVLLVHPEFTITERAVLDLPGHWHRGAVVVEAIWESVPVRIVTTHLSRLEVLRLAQMRTLGQFIMRRPPMQTVLLGDCNDWRLWSGLSFHPRLVGTRLVGPRRATFPVRHPILPLDRILTDAPGCVAHVRVLGGETVLQASDHRPLWGRVEIAPPSPSA